MEKSNTKTIINLIPLLSELSEQKKEVVNRVLMVKKFPKGTIIFVESDPAEAVYFLRKGKVRLSKSSYEGKEVVISILKSGELFAQASLFRNTTYPVTAETIEDSEIVIIRNKDLEKIILRYPEIGVSIIQIMGERLYSAHSKLRDVTLYGKLGALASTLINLAKQYGKKSPEGVIIELTLTHQELANFIGAARENVNRMISTLEKNGVLTMKKGKICIKDFEELRNYIN
ncbi:hypothetical protein BHF71_06555 [Vulcanibacillus modesticaldus]|uniref:Crp/Fnr family transcriptional regulator n=1 Tax=Vulcanibacillus modesticaldus TaxID=337097 RepID=A0A1D2YWI6_9BACI|nr:Crp/Fnr family transcriptional regulator [Vulcanibacillus modesticaldus]OEG00018.1 hypothetical protein BHF71_06555 [Vulcanibacillus modesticaldus]